MKLTAFEQAIQKVVENFATDTHYGIQCIHCHRPVTYSESGRECFHDTECPVEILKDYLKKGEPHEKI